LGVPIKDSGSYDFNDDGWLEQWLVIQHPARAAREFWIIFHSTDKLSALYISDVNSVPHDFKFFQVGEKKQFVLNTPNGMQLFSLSKLGFTGQETVMLSTLDQMDAESIKYLERDKFGQAVFTAGDALFHGADPNLIHEMLSSLPALNGKDCKTPGFCDQFTYLLGLTSEMPGDEQAAINFYLQVWKTYPDSWYGLMARAKLRPVSP
jgi:hypothetical protein